MKDTFLGKYRNEPVVTKDGRNIIYTSPINKDLSLEVAQTGKKINVITFNKTPFGNFIVNDMENWSFKEIEQSLIKMLRESFFASHEEILTESVPQGKFNWEQDIKKKFFDIDEPEQIVNYKSEIYPTSPDEYMIMVEYEDEPEGLELRKKVSYCFHFKVKSNNYNEFENSLFENNEKVFIVMKKYLSSVSKKIIRAVPIKVDDSNKEI